MMHPSRLHGQMRKKLRCVKYMESKKKQYGRRTSNMVNEKWKTVRPAVVQFCRVYGNIMRRIFLLEDMDQDSAHMVAASKVPMLKPDLDTKSMDDLYNNLKLYEAKVKGMSSSNSNTQNMAFLSSINSSTNAAVNTTLAVNTANGFSTVGTQVNTAFSTNIDNLSDAVICAFLASQSDSPQLAHEDLEQIHLDDIEKMDLRWQMAMLTIRARRFLKKTTKKLTINGNKTLGFDMSKVECYKCHKREHFARECITPRNKDNKHKESTRRSVPVETTTSTALVSCDGLGGYNWSDQAEEGPNYALMPYTSLTSDLNVSNDSICSKTYLETVKILKSQNKQLSKALKKPELMVLAYKIGLKSVEKRLEFFKKNKFIYLEDIKVLKVEINMKDIAIKELRRKLEIVDNCKKGLGYESYNDVSPLYTGNFMPSKLDLSFTGLDEFANKHVDENVKAKSSEEEPKFVRKNNDAPIIEEWVSDDEEENASQLKIEKKTVRPSIVKKEFVKPSQQKKTARKSIKKDKGVIDSRCSRHMVKNMSYLTDYEEIDRGYVAFRGNPKGGKITGKCTIKTGKFDGKADEGFFVGYSLNSKAFRVFNSRTNIMEENLHIRFSESTPNVVGSGPDWLFDIDALTRTMNYEPIVADPKSSQDDGFKPSSNDGKKVDEDLIKGNECYDQEKEDNVKSTKNVNAASTNKVNVVDDDAVADMNNLDTTIQVSPTPTTRIHKDHPLDQVFKDLQSATSTRNMTKNLEEHGFVSTIQHRTNHKDLQNCLFACFLSQEEPKKDLKVQTFLIEYTRLKKQCMDYIKLIWFTKVKNASTPIETQKPLLKDEDGKEVDAHMYRIVIGSLKYLTSSRPDMMFVVCAYARYQVNPKVLHLHAVKRIFRKSTTGVVNFLNID
nr:hypothetical protein [Tanacetum cinerariifolium]